MPCLPRRSAVLAMAALALLTPAVRLTSQGKTPANGTDVLAAMRAAYDGKWYHTLTFIQKTTFHRPNGVQEQLWYETLRHTPTTGTQLRIDLGDLSEGNGIIFTPDSTYRVRAGQPQEPIASGNEFLPLIEGVYVQPVAKTVKELAGMKVDLSRLRTGTWQGKPVWVVGTTSAADTTSPQFWVDTERKLLVRMMIRPNANQPPLDVHLGGYEKVGNGAWLATKIMMYREGKPLQGEEYTDWKVGVPVDPALFDLTKWTTAPHWAKK